MMYASSMRGSGYGGRFGQMTSGMMSGDEMARMYASSGMSSSGMGGGPTEPAKKGKDIRSENTAKKRAEQLKAAKSVTVSSLHDPYYHIVEVSVYGQARFFNPPPAEAPAEPSQAENAGAEPAKAEPAKEETPKAAEPAKAEPAKAETPKAEPAKAEPAKAETPKAAEPAKAAPAKAAPAAPKL
jgi:hypothetical protein